MMDAKKTPSVGRGKVKCIPKKNGAAAWVRMGVLIALLLAAGMLLWRQGAGDDGVTPPRASPTPQAARATPPPTQGRTAPETAYDKDVATLTELIGNEQTDQATRTHAAERLAQMVADHQSELGIEEALLQAGFNPCLVLLQNGALTVMVGANELTGTESVTILSLCAAHTDIGVENIRIMTAQGS